MKRISKRLLLTLPQGLARTMLVAAVAITAASATAATRAAASADSSMKAAENNQSAYEGIGGVVGKTIREVRENAVTEGQYPDDMNKIFFLYNVKTGKFINSGGYWGTHILLKDYPMSLWVNINNNYSNETIELTQSMGTGKGHLMGWANGASITNPDCGVFLDRSKGENTHYGWTFEAVEGDEKNTYRIYTYTTISPEETTDKYYLCANIGPTDQEKNCEGMTQSTISSKSLSGYDTWRIMSMQQVYELQKKNTNDMTSPIDMSFMLKCPGFSRGNKDIENWKTKEFGKLNTGGMRYGLERVYNTTNKAATEGAFDKENLSGNNKYTFNGKTYSSKNDYMRDMAKYFCVDAKDVRGVIYQDVKVVYGGSYTIECKGFSNTKKAKLFTVRLDKDKKEVANTMHQTVLSQIEYMSAAEKAELHTDEMNMDYAGKNFYSSSKYFNSILVQVPEQKEGEYSYIRFGVIIGDDANDKEPVKDEWTVFDDFRLLYTSKAVDEDLILDEDRSDLEYLTECSNTYENKVLHLKKSFTRDKWNSIVLPVNLNRDQFRQAFGANAKLAKLSSLTSNEIQFQSVVMDEKGADDVVLDAYTPYILFPTKYMATNEAPAYKALLTKTGETTKSYEVVIPANHIVIPNVTMKKNSEGKNDLTNMNTGNWTTKMTTPVKGNGTMEAYGTFVRTFGTDAKQDLDENSETYGKYIIYNHEFFSNRDNLIGSYFFDKGNLYYSDSRPRGLRGFSCWFKPTNGTQANALKLYLDGIADGATTGIDTIIDFGDNMNTSKAKDGIYSTSGQMVRNGTDTTGLPAGIYIVNGKKCMVK